MSAPTVSVVIPAYRAARTIGRAVDGVLAQTCPPKEILIVDDGSPDDTAAALAPYGDRVRLIRKANGGAASARNLGMGRAVGDLIAFLDADDYWEPVKLERQLAVLARHPEVGVVAGLFYVQAPGAARTPYQPDRPKLFDRVWDRPPGAKAFEIARHIWTSVLLARRETLAGRRFDESLATAEDVDLWVRLAATAPVYLLSEPLATGVLEPGSLSRGDPDGDCRNMLAVVRRHAALLGPAVTRTREAEVYREWAGRHLGEGRPAAALAPAWRRLVRQPWSPQAWWIVGKSAVGAARSRVPAASASERA